VLVSGWTGGEDCGESRQGPFELPYNKGMNNACQGRAGAMERQLVQHGYVVAECGVELWIIIAKRYTPAKPAQCRQVAFVAAFGNFPVESIDDDLVVVELAAAGVSERFETAASEHCCKKDKK